MVSKATLGRMKASLVAGDLENTLLIFEEVRSGGDATSFEANVYVVVLVSLRHSDINSDSRFRGCFVPTLISKILLNLIDCRRFLCCFLSSRFVDVLRLEAWASLQVCG